MVPDSLPARVVLLPEELLAAAAVLPAAAPAAPAAPATAAAPALTAAPPPVWRVVESVEHAVPAPAPDPEPADFASVAFEVVAVDCPEAAAAGDGVPAAATGAAPHELPWLPVLRCLPELLDVLAAAPESTPPAPAASAAAPTASAVPTALAAPAPSVSAPALEALPAAACDAEPTAEWWAAAPFPDAPAPDAAELPPFPTPAVAAANTLAPAARPDLAALPAGEPMPPSAEWWDDAAACLAVDALAVAESSAPAGRPRRRACFEAGSRLVRVEPEFAPLARFLFGPYVVADDLEKALAARDSGAHPGPIVTRSGELLDEEGVLSGGPSETGLTILSRKAELRELEQALGERRAELESRDGARATTHADADAAALRDKELKDRIYDLAHDLTEKDHELAALARQSKMRREEAEVNRLERAELAGQIESFAEKEAAVRRLIEDLTAYEQDLTIEIEQLGLDLRTAQAEREGLAGQVADLKALSVQLAERRKGQENALVQLEREGAQLEGMVRSTEAALAQGEERAAATRAAIVARGEEAARLEADLGSHQACVAEAQAARAAAAREAAARAETLKAGRGRIQALLGEIHQVELEAAKHENDLEHLVRQTQNELSLNLAELLAATPEDPPLDWEAVMNEVAELKRRLDAVGGGVNLAAIDELKEAEKNFTDLSTQQIDLDKSKSSLEDLMRKVNKECREKFEATLIQVRENFSTLFRKLFGGGKADILLEPAPEGADEMDCGIEIMAKPPGKEPTSISLLSGGEKAMTTLALVMGIFQLKPSPFCIMDEVDAPLDEANLDRFAAMVKEFAQTTQFLLITHNKKSMAIAQAIYGVTQQEKGVSKKISVKLVEELEAVGAVGA